MRHLMAYELAEPDRPWKWVAGGQGAALLTTCQPERSFCGGRDPEGPLTLVIWDRQWKPGGEDDDVCPECRTAQENLRDSIRSRIQQHCDEIRARVRQGLPTRSPRPDRVLRNLAARYTMGDLVLMFPVDPARSLDPADVEKLSPEQREVIACWPHATLKCVKPGEPNEVWGLDVREHGVFQEHCEGIRWAITDYVTSTRNELDLEGEPHGND